MMYEYGEKVLVRDDDKELWKERIFIGPGKDESVVTVACHDWVRFEEGRDFGTAWWLQHKKKPKTVTIGTREVPAPITGKTPRYGNVWCIDLPSCSLCFESEKDMKFFIAALEDLGR